MSGEKLKSFLGGITAKRINVWLFYGFLITFPLSIRKVLTFYPIQGAFNEYTGIYLYLSDLFLLATLALWGYRILCNNWRHLSMFSFSRLKESFLEKKWLKIRINPLVTLPLLLVIWSFVSISWSSNQVIAFFRSAKLLEFILLYLYIRLNFINTFRDDLFHVEQIPQNKISKNCSTRLDSQRCIVDARRAGNNYNLNNLDQNRVFRNFLVIFIVIGLFEALMSFLQIVNNGSMGLRFLKESTFSLNMTGVAKIILWNIPFIRPYGLFPHPNVLGAYLLVVTIVAFWYFRLAKAILSNNTIPYKDTIPRETILLKWKSYFTVFKKFLEKISCSIWNIFSSTLDQFNVPRGTICQKYNNIKNITQIISQNKTSQNCYTHTLKMFHVKQFIRKNLKFIIISMILVILGEFGLFKPVISFLEIVNSGSNKAICLKYALSQQILVNSDNLAICRNLSSQIISLLEILTVVVAITIFLTTIWKLLRDFLIGRKYSFISLQQPTQHRFGIINAGLFLKSFYIKQFSKIKKFSNRFSEFCSTWNNSSQTFIFRKIINFLFHVEQNSILKIQSAKIVPRGTIFAENFEKLVPRLTIYALIWLFPLLALFLTFSKNAIIGLFVAIFAINYQLYLSKKGCSTLDFGYLKPFITSKVFSRRNILLAGIFLMILLNLHPSFESLFSRSMDDRIIFQNVSRGTISTNLFWGVGSGQFVWKMDQYSTMPLLAWQYQPVHNVFSLIWSELGLVGLILFIGFIFTVFRSFKTSIVTNSQLIHKKAVFRGLFLAFLFMLLFDHYFWDIQQGMALWWIILALV